MKKRISHVAPMQLGIVLAALYGAISLLFVPFVLLFTLFGPKSGGHGSLGALILVILLPLGYAIAGFIGGVICAAVYNLIASWTGGIELTLSDVQDGPASLSYQAGQAA